MITVNTNTGPFTVQTDGANAFRALVYKGIVGCDEGRGLCIQIPTSVALALATNPDTDLMESGVICYLLQKRALTQGMCDTDRRALADAVSKLRGRLHGIEAAGKTQSPLGRRN